MRICQGTEPSVREDCGPNIAADSESLGKDSVDRTVHFYGDAGASQTAELESGKQNLSADAQEKILALYDEYRPRLYRYMRSMQLGRDLAEEVIQETFMRLTMELLKENCIENVQGWVIRVAHNLAVNLLKRERNPFLAKEASTLVIENRIDPALGPDETYSQKERTRRIKQALAALKPQHRQCFEMRVQGFRYKDISLALGISEQRAAFVVKQVAVRLAAICG